MPQLLASLTLPAVLAIPLLWVVLSLFRAGGAGLWLTGAGAALQLAAALLLTWQVGDGGGRHLLGNWPAPLGIALRADGAAAAFVLLTAIVAGACALHAQLYLRHEGHKSPYFWPLLWFLWAGLNGVWLSADLFNLYVCLELVSLCAVGLVAIEGHARALGAALRYLMAALAGSLAYLLGVALLYSAFGVLDLPALAAAFEPLPAAFAALGLITVGLLFKTALFPLHGWLPPAHGGAIAPVSALLSGLVIKAPFYILVRIWLELGGPGEAGAQALGLLGAAAIVWGSWQALHQARLKMVVAYSTVAQIGYFFLFFPLVAQGAPLGGQQARDGVLLLVVSHALAKAAMFLAAGNLVAATGRDAVASLAGISRFRPISLFSFGLAGISLMGLPPSGAFSAKWLLLQSALAAGDWYWALALVLGGLATAAYVFRVFQESFREGGDVFQHPSRWLEAAPMGLALASVLLGLFAVWPLSLIGGGAGGEGG